MLRFYKGDPLSEGRVGVFPGSFNPVTTAHLALAEAALAQHRLGQVIFLLPEVFPHKDFEGASFDDRLALLAAAAAEEPRFAIASSRGGLFIEMAREVRAGCGPAVEVFVLCGRDAAERAVNWDYGDGPSFDEQIEEFQMLVASRQGRYEAPRKYARRIHKIELPRDFDGVSATRIRQAIREGRGWRGLVPGGVAQEIVKRGLYRGR